MQKKFATAFKLLMVFIAATMLANSLCYFYFSPAVQIPNEKHFTELKLIPGNHNPYGIEGYGNITIDENGFNNMINFPYQDARALFLGSSQTEAQHVGSQENYVARLNNALPDLYGYNLGISGSTFVTTFVRISALIKNFPKAEVLVFEINVMPTLNELTKLRDELASGALPDKDISWKANNPFMYLAARMPLARLIYIKYKTSHPVSTAAAKKSAEPPEFDAAAYENTLREVLTLGKSVASSRKIVIFSIDRLQQNPDGSAAIAGDNGETAIFAKVSAELGIDYIPTGKAFLTAYNNQHTFPCGFYNTAPNAGHLNIYGHQAIADELAPVLGGIKK